MKKFMDYYEDNLNTIISSLLAIIAGLIFGFVIILFSKSGNPFGAFSTILFGGFKEGSKSLGDVLFLATPIMFTGLAVAFSFKTGMLNIGASGQYTIGAILAIIVGVLGTGLPTFLHITLALIAAMIGGALWALIPSLLKAFRNVNEVVTTIMMNYLAMYTTKLLIVKFVYNPITNETLDVQESAVIPSSFLEKIFPGSQLNISFLLILAIAIIVYIFLYKTTYGLALRSVGSNRHASRYAGINEKSSIIVSMLISGAIAGIGGAVVFLTASGKHMQNLAIIYTEGFDGIPVALLANSHPLGVVFSAIFIGYLKVSGFYLQLFQIKPEIINIIISSIIYFSALSLLFRKYSSKILDIFVKGDKT